MTAQSASKYCVGWNACMHTVAAEHVLRRVVHRTTDAQSLVCERWAEHVQWTSCCPGTGSMRSVYRAVQEFLQQWGSQPHQCCPSRQMAGHTRVLCPVQTP